MSRFLDIAWLFVFVSVGVEARRIQTTDQLLTHRAAVPAHDLLATGNETLSLEHKLEKLAAWVPPSGGNPSSLMQVIYEQPFSASLLQVMHNIHSQKHSIPGLGEVPLHAFGMLVLALVPLATCWCWLDWCVFAQRKHFEDQDKDIRQQHIVDGKVVYEWSQTPEVATIFIRLPRNSSKNDLDIKIASKHLRVGRRGKPCAIKAELFNSVDKESSRWTLRGKTSLQIYLRKAHHAEWPYVLHLSKVGSWTAGDQKQVQ